MHLYIIFNTILFLFLYYLEPKMNVYQLSGPDPEKGFALRLPPKKLNPIVEKALAKFCDQKTLELIYSFRRSSVTPEALIADFQRCDRPVFKIQRDDIYLQAIEIVRTIMKPKYPLRLIKFMDLRLYPWTINTSAEEPFTNDKRWIKRINHLFNQGELLSRRLNFHNLYNVIFSYNKDIVELIGNGENRENQFFYNRTAHARSHLVSSDEPDKVRMVFGVPKLHLQIECMLLWDYIRQARIYGNNHILWGYEMLNGGMLKLNSELSNPIFQTFLCFDFRMYDKTLLFEMIDDAHEILKSYYSDENMFFPNVQDPPEFYSPEYFSNLWKFMKDIVKYAPNRMPDGSSYKLQFNGLPSGLLQTQLLDSFCNLIIMITVLLEMGIYTIETLLKVLGDDSIVALQQLIPMDKHEEFFNSFALIVKRRFNMEVSPLSMKSSMTNLPNGTYILGYYNENGIPKRPAEPLLASLLHRERPLDAADLRGLAIGIAYASASGEGIVYDVCKEIFDKAGIYNEDINLDAFNREYVIEEVYGLNILDLKHFPSREEINSRLYTPPELKTFRLWNTDYFCADLP